MGEITKVQWAHHTFNPWRGCTKIAAGCDHCYAERGSLRNPKLLGQWGAQGTRVVASESMWREPLKWNEEAKAAGERRRVFCASLADVFEDWRGPMLDSDGSVMWCTQAGKVIKAGQCKINNMGKEQPASMDDVRGKLFDLILSTPNLDWLILTKRPENARLWIGKWEKEEARRRYPERIVDIIRPANLWLGVSIAEQKDADKLIPILLTCPAAVRFVSAEPLTEEVNLLRACELSADILTRRYLTLDEWGLDWVIVGGESGSVRKSRPFDLAWARSILAQCQAAGVPCFIKQLGRKPRWSDDDGVTDGPLSGPIDLADPKGGDPEEWPEDLRVREIPKVEAHHG